MRNYFFKLGLSRSEGSTPEQAEYLITEASYRPSTKLSGAHHEAKKIVSNTVIQLKIEKVLNLNVLKLLKGFKLLSNHNGYGNDIDNAHIKNS